MGEGTGVVVSLAMNEQNGRFQLMGMEERRHHDVNILCFPNVPGLRLKSEGRQAPVVGAAARDAGFEQIGVGQQVGGHKSAIGVSAHGNPVPVGDTAIHHENRWRPRR